ncbi:MAG: HEAT repeat domain-containing protein [Candidatus Binatia bacterium]
MESSSDRNRGIAILAALPWLVAAGSLLVAAIWVRSTTTSEPAAVKDGGGSPEVESLRLSLSTAEAEKEALRRELDRILRGGPGGGVAAPKAGTTDGAEAAEALAHIDGLAARAREALGQGVTPESMRAVADLANSGPEAHDALRELYEANPDPAVRRLLLPTLTFVGGQAKGLEFVAAELAKGAEPEMRNQLLLSASTFTDQETVPVLRDHFLGALNDPSTPEPLQQRMVRALGKSSGPDVESALVGAAGHPSEKVRMAAYEQLAARRGMRERLREFVGREQSPLARELGNCQLLIAENR